MHTTALLSTLLALTLRVTALPSANTDTATTTTTGTSLNDFLSSPMTFEKRQTNTTHPSATVQLCSAPGFSGQCANTSWPVNMCIDLRGYAGVTESFQPDDGFECLLMQGKCDATRAFVSIGDSDKTEGSDLTTFGWIQDAASYMCFTELAALQRFVRISKMRVANLQS